MDLQFTPEQDHIRRAIREICADFPGEYWRELDSRDAYPTEFVTALTEGGWLAVLIPEQYGGIGAGVVEGSIILEEINRSGGNAAACHAQMYIMGHTLAPWERRAEGEIPRTDRRRRPTTTGLWCDGAKCRIRHHPN